MFNDPPNELRNIQREIDRIVDAMIALLPPDEQTKMIFLEECRHGRLTERPGPLTCLLA